MAGFGETLKLTQHFEKCFLDEKWTAESSTVLKSRPHGSQKIDNFSVEAIALHYFWEFWYYNQSGYLMILLKKKL